MLRTALSTVGGHHGRTIMAAFLVLSTTDFPRHLSYSTFYDAMKNNKTLFMLLIVDHQFIIASSYYSSNMTIHRTPLVVPIL